MKALRDLRERFEASHNYYSNTGGFSVEEASYYEGQQSAYSSAIDVVDEFIQAYEQKEVDGRQLVADLSAELKYLEDQAKYLFKGTAARERNTRQLGLIKRTLAYLGPEEV